jgi:hypothetical protein
METLHTILVEQELQEAKEAILALYKQYKTSVKSLNKTLKEGVLDFDSNDLDYQFDEAKRRFQVARQSIKLANKLGDPAQKSRVFANMNKLNGFIKRLQRDIEAELERLKQEAQGKQVFQQRPPSAVRTQQPGAPRVQAPQEQQPAA